MKSSSRDSLRPQSAGSHASYNSHDSSISWLLGLDHHGVGVYDREEPFSNDGVSHKRLQAGGRYGFGGSMVPITSANSGSAPKKKHAALSRSSAKKDRARHRNGERGQSSRIHSPYERDPLPLDLQRELEQQLIAKGRMPKNGRVDKFGNVAISSSSSGSSVTEGDANAPVIEVYRGHRMRTPPTVLKLFEEFKRNLSGNMTTRRDKLVGDILSSLSDEARLIGSSIFLEKDRATWNTSLKGELTMSNNEIRDHDVEPFLLTKRIVDGTNVGFTEEKRLVKTTNTSHRFDPLYHIMLEESRPGMEEKNSSATPKESDIVLSDLNALRNMNPSLEEWIVYRVIFFLLESYYKLVVVNDPVVSFDYEGGNVGHDDSQQLLSDSTKDISVNLWKIFEGTQKESRNSLSADSFSWSIIPALLQYPKSFLSSLNRIERGQEGLSDHFYQKFSDYSTLSQLCGTSLFHPAYTAKSSPITSQLCSWARRVIAGLYLSRAEIRTVHQDSIMSFSNHQLPSRYNIIHGLHTHSSTCSSGTNESTSLGSSQLFEAVDHVKSTGLVRGNEFRFGGDSAKVSNDESLSRSGWRAAMSEDKFLIGDTTDISAVKRHGRIAILCCEGAAGDHLTDGQINRLLSAGISIAKCSDKIDLIQFDHQDHEGLRAMGRLRRIGESSSMKGDASFKRSTISVLHSDLILQRMDNIPIPCASMSIDGINTNLLVVPDADPSNAEASISIKQTQTLAKSPGRKNHPTKKCVSSGKERLLALLSQSDFSANRQSLIIVMIQSSSILDELPRSFPKFSLLIVPLAEREPGNGSSVNLAKYTETRSPFDVCSTSPSTF
jgi:hypothetical protein